MHVLGHSFSNRRKSKPRDLHIRKVSFSGFSLSGSSFSSISGSSLSSGGSSFSSISSPRNPSTATTASFDPLQLHPPFQPPPRLYDRPLIPAAATDREEDERYDEDGDAEGSDSEKDQDRDEEQQQQQEPQDYFDFIRLVNRRHPCLPRSRWSESTIQTLDELTPVTSASDSSTPVAIADMDEEVDPLDVVPYKCDTAPKRPSIKPMDSFDDWIKRGGWKRRGVVFQTEDMNGFDERM